MSSDKGVREIESPKRTVCVCQLSKNKKQIHQWNSSDHLFVSIDVGITHLGLAWSKVDENFRSVLVGKCKLVDLCNMKHKNVKRSDCKLKHSKGMYDRVHHFVQEYKWLFDSCCRILIERQPVPMGCTATEQILLGARRNKSKLVSPNAMHCYFGINKFEDDVVMENGEKKLIKTKYEKRKDETIEIAKQYMTPDCLAKFNSYSRNHDVADACCLLIFHVSQLREKYDQEQTKRKQRENFKKLHGVDTETFLQQFRYNPYCDRK
jgi:hypothetical protein